MSSIFLSVGELVSKLSLEDQVYLAKEADFDGIDYILSLPDLVGGGKKIQQLSKKYNIPIKGIHIPLLMIPYAPSLFFNRLHHIISNFNECEIFNVHLSSFITPLHKSGNNIQKFLNIMKKKKLIISFESNPNGRLLRTYPKITYDPDLFANFCIENNLPINFDLSHIATFNYDINKFYRNYSKYIALLHVSDFNGKKQHLPFGKGELPLSELFRNIKKTSYPGKVIFEIYQFPQNASREQLLKEIRNNLTMFKRLTR